LGDGSVRRATPTGSHDAAVTNPDATFVRGVPPRPVRLGRADPIAVWLAHGPHFEGRELGAVDEAVLPTVPDARIRRQSRRRSATAREALHLVHRSRYSRAVTDAGRAQDRKARERRPRSNRSAVCMFVLTRDHAPPHSRSAGMSTPSVRAVPTVPPSPQDSAGPAPGHVEIIPGSYDAMSGGATPDGGTFFARLRATRAPRWPVRRAGLSGLSVLIEHSAQLPSPAAACDLVFLYRLAPRWGTDGAVAG